MHLALGMWVSWWTGPWEFLAQILLTGNKIMSATHVEHMVLSTEAELWDAKLLMEFSVCVFHGFLNRPSSLLSKLPTESKLHPSVEWAFIYFFYSLKKKRKVFCFLTFSLSYTAISFPLLKMLENEPSMKTHVAFWSVWPQSIDPGNVRV